MASGIKVNDNCKVEFQNIKANHMYRYIIFNVSKDEKEICVTKTAGKDATFGDLYDDLIAIAERNTCCYAVLDYEFVDNNKMNTSKLVFIYWSPDSCTPKPKMVYAASKDAFIRAIEPGIKVVQMNDASDLTEAAILEKVSKAT